MIVIVCRSSRKLSEVQHTLSRMTSGPLTPPIVLYFSRGLIEVMRGSSMEGAMLAGWEERCRDPGASVGGLKLF